MEKVKVLDKTFKLSISEAEIQKRVKELAAQMNKDLEGKSPLFVCILNGAFMFASDLFKQITVEDASITFFRLSSYVGTCSRFRGYRRYRSDNTKYRRANRRT